MLHSKAPTKHAAVANKDADFVLREDDNVIRWRKVAELGRKMNPKIAKEHEKQSKAMAEVRRQKIYRSTRKEGQLRFGVSIPPLTWRLLREADLATLGRSDLIDANKQNFLEKDATNTVVQQLREAFPEYRAY